jgi:hypothetical protein
VGHFEFEGLQCRPAMNKPTLQSLIGEPIVACIPYIDQRAMIYKLHAIETSGIWVESQAVTDHFLKQFNAAASPRSLVLFVPFSGISCIYANVDGPALSREAFGVPEQ